MFTALDHFCPDQMAKVLLLCAHSLNSTTWLECCVHECHDDNTINEVTSQLFDGNPSRLPEAGLKRNGPIHFPVIIVDISDG